MDAVTILEKYFESKANVDDILNLKVGKKLFPKDTDQNSVNKVLQCLQRDRSVIMDTIKNNIRHEFSVPIKDIIGEIEEFDEAIQDTHTVNSLLRKLQGVEGTMRSQCDSLDVQIDSVTKDIELLNEQLKQIEGDSTSIEDAVKAVELLDEIIHPVNTH
ncbi:hypothetical protein CLIB1444_14S02146 [[Candida] jaroonii]|uniref:Uncharacterized protein n=1 Tax=[Candida] jaroonii TaxID=467808 RepID=A0ACA9YE49_9ASCO|nr:hypothetical protein CLIB1444_14S02146 [[Candida] jaroonii]